jgi:hypothetical protein
MLKANTGILSVQCADGVDDGGNENERLARH